MNTLKKTLSVLLISTSALSIATAQEVVTIDNSLGTTVEFDETEGMTIRYDSLLNDWKAKMYLYVDSTCHGTDIDPTFPDSVYIDRLQRIPAVMELPYNHIVRQYIDRYTKRLRKSVSVMLGAGNFYFPIFEDALERYGLPLELKYLPVIESALKAKAVSPAGAGGLWQFMVGTGKQYQLKVNSVIDERCDPIKSSDAAARYLRDLYRIYNDWALVLAAYNCGPGNVNRAIHRAGARDYWQIYPFLPKETRGYVPAFIAATYAMTYYCEHGICPMRSKFPIATDTIIIHRDISMRQISEVVGISLDVLKSLNPQYRTDRIPGKSQDCILRMPDDMLHAFLDYGDDIYKYRASELLARRAEVSVRGERNRTSSRRTEQPSAPPQNTMPGSNQPNIAETEAVVPQEQVASQTPTPATANRASQQNPVAGEVIEVAVAEKEDNNNNAEAETSTTIALDDEEGSLQPVQTNTRRTPTASSSSSRTTTARSQQQQAPQQSTRQTTTNRSPKQQTQQQSTRQTTTNRNRQQQAQQQSTSQTTTNRSPKQQTQQQSTRQTTTNHSRQQQTQQQSTRQTTTNRNRQQQTQQQSTRQTTTNRSHQQQTQQQSTRQTTTNRSRKQQTQQQSTRQTTTNRSRQQQQQSTRQTTTNRSRQQQQQSTRQTNTNRSRQQQQQSTRQTTTNRSPKPQAKPQPKKQTTTTVNRPRKPQSGKAGSVK